MEFKKTAKQVWNDIASDARTIYSTANRITRSNAVRTGARAICTTTRTAYDTATRLGRETSRFLRPALMPVGAVVAGACVGKILEQDPVNVSHIATEYASDFVHNLRNGLTTLQCMALSPGYMISDCLHRLVGAGWDYGKLSTFSRAIEQIPTLPFRAIRHIPYSPDSIPRGIAYLGSLLPEPFAGNIAESARNLRGIMPQIGATIGALAGIKKSFLR